MEGKEKVERLKKLYPKGTVIRLIHMDDEQAPEPGTLGSVLYVDGIGTIHMRWDNGSGLGLIEGLDQFEVVGLSHREAVLKATLEVMSENSEALEKLAK